MPPTSNTTIANFTMKEFIHFDKKERRVPFKGQSEFKFYLSATKHRMRVMHPEDAKLFLVPTFSYYIGLSIVYGNPAEETLTCMCNNGVCGKDHLARADDVLDRSQSFQRSMESDHITLMTSLFWLISWGQSRKNSTSKPPKVQCAPNGTGAGT